MAPAITTNRAGPPSSSGRTAAVRDIMRNLTYS